jgi:flagellar biosynthesis/type III secretory pathway M-ring protein FliF/YscJ
MILASIIEQPWFVIVMLLLIFGSIVIIVMLIKKYAKPFQNQEKPKSDKEIAEEEVNRMVVDINPEDDKKLDEASKELAQETASKDLDKPTEKEALEEEVNRSTRPVEDEEAAKAMAKYAAEHPEEAEAVQSKDESKKK